MKKVLYFIPTFSVISETFILREVQTLIDFGNLDIKVLSLQEGTAKIPDNVKKKVIYYRPKIYEVILSLPFVLANLRSVIGTLQIVLNEHEGKLFSNFKTFLKSIIYARYISKLGVDHLHAHFVSEPSTLIMFVSNILSKPFSISGHATDVFRDHDMVQAKSKRAVFVALCNSYAYQEFIKLSKRKGRKNVNLIYHGIDYLKFVFKKRDFDRQSEIKVLTDARFVEKKGLTVLSQAIIDLNKNLNVSLTIVGVAQTDEQRNYKDSLVTLFKKAQLENKLIIPNDGKGLQIEEVVGFYENSDIFIYSGIDAGKGDVDGVPNALLQAAFSGLPIITTQSGSISDLFNSENSYLIHQNNSQDIVDKFMELVTDKNRNKKCDTLYNQAVKEFSLFVNTKELESLFLK